jgi:hypothetical protein
MNLDSNHWGLICVPLGLLLGFGPVLWAAAFTSPDPSESDKRGKDSK